jgi:hypothetical protein
MRWLIYRFRNRRHVRELVVRAILEAAPDNIKHRLYRSMGWPLPARLISEHRG